MLLAIEQTSPCCLWKPSERMQSKYASKLITSVYPIAVLCKQAEGFNVSL